MVLFGLREPWFEKPKLCSGLASIVDSALPGKVERDCACSTSSREKRAANEAGSRCGLRLLVCVVTTSI